jgi:hypothetical protein
MSERQRLNKKGRDFLKKAFTGRAKIVGPAGAHTLRFGAQKIACGGGWGSLESMLEVPHGTEFAVLERQADGATLLLAEGRSLDEADSIAKLRWDQSGYRLHFVAAATAAARSQVPWDARGVLHHESGADIYVHEFTPERTMLALALHDGDGAVIGIALGDSMSLAPLAPPPVGCPVLRALVSRYAELYGVTPASLFADPDVAARLQASHHDDKKMRTSVAARHAERALQHRLARAARVLERVEGFCADAEVLRRTQVRLARGATRAELGALEQRLMEAEAAAHPALGGELRYPYARLAFGAAGCDMTPVERDVLELGGLAGRVTALCLGPSLSTGDLQAVRAWSEVVDLSSLCAALTRAAATILAWSRWPDVAAARALLDGVATERPTIGEIFDHVCPEPSRADCSPDLGGETT